MKSRIASRTKKMFKKNALTMLGAVLCKSGISDLTRLLDYREIGGTPFLGIRKPVIKAHGSSDRLAFRNAVKQAIAAAENNPAPELEKMLAKLAAEKESSHD